MVKDAVFFWGDEMQIMEQLECLHATVSDPSRVVRVKRLAAVSGLVLLIMVLIAGQLFAAGRVTGASDIAISDTGMPGHD